MRTIFLFSLEEDITQLKIVTSSLRGVKKSRDRKIKGERTSTYRSKSIAGHELVLGQVLHHSRCIAVAQHVVGRADTITKIIHN